MIKYKLKCKKCNLLFDSWFGSSKEYEKLKKNKFLNCYSCKSFQVEKTLMSPNVLKSKKDLPKNLEIKNLNKIKKTIKDYQKFIKNNFEYVGTNFAYEARSLHYKSKKRLKGIYGNASQEEIKELRDEGIDTHIIPWLEDKSN